MAKISLQPKKLTFKDKVLLLCDLVLRLMAFGYFAAGAFHVKENPALAAYYIGCACFFLISWAISKFL